MKRFSGFVLIAVLGWGYLFGTSFSADTRQLSYTFEPEFLKNSMILHVEMVFLGNSSGRTQIILPDEWAGQKKLYESITGLSSPDSNIQLEKTSKSHTRRIIHEPNKWIRIHYCVKQQWEGPIEGQRAQKYWPILDKEYFHFYGMVFFVFPERFRSSLTRFKILWKNFPTEWSIGNSFGCQKRQQNFSAFLENVRRSIYFGGDYRIKKILVQKYPVNIALRGGDWQFSDEAFFSFVEKLINEERNFWEEYEFPYFLIVLTPFGRGHKNSGGTSLFQSFDVFFYSDASMNFDFKYLFSHELFHTWNTGKLGVRQSPEQLLYWFSEGFTDYYARLLLLRAGLITLEEYVSDYNDKISRYYLSPVREASNQKILEGYWSNDDLGRLPYQRGDVIAHRWNTLIKKKTDGLLSLDDIMRSLFRSAQHSSQVISNELLFERVKQMTGLDIREDLETFIQEGHLIKISGDELGSCFNLRKTDYPQYQTSTRSSPEKEYLCRKWFKMK